MYTLTMRLMHALPELAQCLGGSKEKFGREEVLDWLPNWRSTELLCWLHCCMPVKHGQSTNAMPGNWIASIWTILGRFWRSPGRIRYQTLRSLLELNCQAMSCTLGECIFDGLATLFECKMYTCQKRLFYGELAWGRWSHGGQRKRYKDTLKVSLKNFGIDCVTWDTLAKDCLPLCTHIKEGA